MRSSQNATKDHGEELLDLLGMFIGASNAEVVRSPGVLEVRQGAYLSRVTATTPTLTKTGSGTVLTILRMQAEVPAEVEPFLGKPGALGMFNRLATLAAATCTDGKLFIGSRLSVFEEDEPFLDLHGPLMVGATLFGAVSMLQGMHAVVSGQPSAQEPCAWTPADFQAAQKSLHRFCDCNADADGMTAELSIAPGSGSVVVGDPNTALWELTTKPGHPEAGGGILCRLEMPQQMTDEHSLSAAIDALNSAEMDAIEAPPHLGAWCVGRTNLNPAYVTFVPNHFREAIERLPMFLAVWASARGAWARAELERQGMVD